MIPIPTEVLTFNSIFRSYCGKTNLNKTQGFRVELQVFRGRGGVHGQDRDKFGAGGLGPGG